MGGVLKWLLVLLAVAVTFWMLGTRGRARKDQGGDSVKGGRRGPALQEMVTCAHCGLHLPAAESLSTEGPDGRGQRLRYCSEEHRRRGPAPH